MGQFYSRGPARGPGGSIRSKARDPKVMSERATRVLRGTKTGPERSEGSR